MLPQNLIFFKENQKGPQPEILFVILGLFKQPRLAFNRAWKFFYFLNLGIDKIKIYGILI